MPTNTPTKVIAFASLALLTLPALGQMVTPPPATVPAPNEYLPKPPVMPPAPPPAPPVNIAPPARAKPVPVTLPDLPYQSLVKRDAAGVLGALGEPIDLAALRVNPMLKPESWENIRPVLSERRATFRRAIIDHLDIVEEVDGGLIDRADYGNKEGITTIVNRLHPLTPKSVPGALTQDLVERKLLSPEEAGFSRKIMKEYQDATYPPDDKDPAKRTERNRKIVRIIQRASVDEPMQHYYDLAAEVATNLPALAKSAGLPDLPPGPAAKAEQTREAKVAFYKSATSALTTDQRRALLRAATANDAAGGGRK
jgi:hypothetical protein